jgi:hypothetical protein
MWRFAYSVLRSEKEDFHAEKIGQLDVAVERDAQKTAGTVSIKAFRVGQYPARPGREIVVARFGKNFNWPPPDRVFSAISEGRGPFCSWGSRSPIAYPPTATAGALTGFRRRAHNY